MSLKNAQFLSVVLVLATLSSLAAAVKPTGGKFLPIHHKLHLTKTGDQTAKDNYNFSCKSLFMYEGGRVYLKGTKYLDTNNEIASANVTVIVHVLRTNCVTDLGCSPGTNFNDINDKVTYTFFPTTVHNHREVFSLPMMLPAQKRDANSSSTVGEGDHENTKENSTTAPNHIPKNTNHQYTIYKTNTSGNYMVTIQSILDSITNGSKGDNVELTFTLEMGNYYGYLSAIDYPALVFYGMMTAIYAILGIVWCVAMCCSYKELIRLQFWIFAVVILGFLEKTFFVSEYSSINRGEESSALNLLAEVMSAAKRALARVLIIIVSLGFGTVRPRLGDSLGKVVAVGAIYFFLAIADGVVRARASAMEIKDPVQIVTMALLFIMDSIIFCWVFTSLVNIRRALRLRKNYVKLSMYNHFAYTLIFAIIAAIVFMVWTFIVVTLPQGSCHDDWKELWLRDCIWHILFCVILIVIMIIWRPSANTNRFAYSLVNDVDEDEDEREQIENKNFETLKMRSVGKSDTVPPPVSSQAEDDLRWVEENLPTTAMDKALPLILDSDEEVMNTKFEASKLN